MKHEFTDGPWTLKRSKRGMRMKVSGRRWTSFASVVIRMDGAEDDNNEGVANARLIAAAPDLLAALQILIDPDSGRLFIEFDKIIKAKEKKQILKAIKKATSVKRITSY